MPQKKKQRCLSPACLASSSSTMNECYSPACRAKNKEKKQHSHAYFYEENKQLVNGKVVKDSAIKSEYNGQQLHVDKRDKNTFEHYTVKDKILNKLLANPVSNIGLLERLSTDFNITKKRRHTHKKHTHKKHTHKKHKAHKHKAHKHKKH